VKSIVIGTVIKKTAKKRVVEVIRRLTESEVLLQQLRF